MNLITVDLGTTNIKVSVFDQKLRLIDMLSYHIDYERNNEIVEFDADNWFDKIQHMIRSMASKGMQFNGQAISQVVLTGQAESLVILGANHRPLRASISWLDMRSSAECRQLSSIFSAEAGYQVTGQPGLIPTWPISKILWLKHNEPHHFSQAKYYLMIKDYIVYRLCGRMAGDYSIYSFSYYFDIKNKTYWNDILNYCDIETSQLAELLPPCSVAGCLDNSLITPQYGLTAETKINIGTLDHFSGMIGTGNIQEGIISESAGTVLSLATLVSSPDFSAGRLPINCGPFAGSYVLMPVCESGGFSLEWFKHYFIPDKSFPEINQMIQDAAISSPPLFLPYLTGVNAPDYNEDACGTFFAVHASHGPEAFALAIMQGVACLLTRNLRYLASQGIRIEKIISVGGGAKSQLWNQIKADFSGVPFEIPVNEEAVSLGAAIIGAVSEGYFADYQSAVAETVKMKQTYHPQNRADYQATYQLFTSLYQALQSCFTLNSATR